MSTAIRFILEHHVSRRDINGNVSWYHVLTSTKTGKYLVFESCDEGSARKIVRNASGCGMWQAIHETYSRDEPIRDFNRYSKARVQYFEHEHEKLASAIRDLEKTEV